MKIVFVNLVDDLYHYYSNYLINQPPLSLGVLATLSANKGFDIEILDEQIENLNFDGDIFAFSICTQLAKKIYHYADMLRNQGKKVILGGYHATVNPEECKKHADSIVIGEAEYVWQDVLKDLKSGNNKKFYRSNNNNKTLDIPVINRKFFKNHKYLVPNTMFLSRGCNHNCDFCVSSKIFGEYKLRPLKIVEKEIDSLNLKGWKSTLMFIDDNPFVDKEYADKLFKILKNRKIKWVAQITMEDLCNKEFMQKLSDAGCVNLGVGVESVFADNYLSINKKQNLNIDIKATVKYANSLGIGVIAFLIFGLMHDTKISVQQAIKQLKKIPFSQYDLCLLRVYPGCVLYDKMLDQGKVIDKWWLQEEDLYYNKLLPGYLRIYFDHNHINPKDLQIIALESISKLNSIFSLTFLKVLLHQIISNHPKYALMHIAARLYIYYQALCLRIKFLKAGRRTKKWTHTSTIG